MQPGNLAVGLETPAFHRIFGYLFVLHQEVTHGNVRRNEHRHFFFFGDHSFRKLLSNLFSRSAIDTAPLAPGRGFYPVTRLPAPIRSFARAATLAVPVLSGHEQTSFVLV